MWFDVDVLDLQLKLQCRLFGPLFTKIGQNFNQISGHTGQLFDNIVLFANFSFLAFYRKVILLAINQVYY